MNLSTFLLQHFLFPEDETCFASCFPGGRGADGAAGRLGGPSGDRSVHGPDTAGTKRGLKHHSYIVIRLQ